MDTWIVTGKLYRRTIYEAFGPFHSAQAATDFRARLKATHSNMQTIYLTSPGAYTQPKEEDFPNWPDRPGEPG